MVVKSPSSFVLTLLGIGHSAHVAPVVIAEQDEHIVGHLHSLVIIVKHFFIKSPYLRSLLGRTLGHISNNLTLVLHDALHQFRIGLFAHRLIAVAAHTNRHDIIRAFHALNTFTKETVQILLVRMIVPRAPALTVAGILLMVTCHRFMMGSTHHYAHFIGCFHILGIIGIESPAPHGRPHIVALQAQNQFKNLLVETMVAIVRSECILHP